MAAFDKNAFDVNAFSPVAFWFSTSPDGGGAVAPIVRCAPLVPALHRGVCIHSEMAENVEVGYPILAQVSFEGR